MQNKHILVIDDDHAIWQAYSAVLCPERELNSSRQQMAKLLMEPEEASQMLAVEAAEPAFQLRFASQGKEGLAQVQQVGAQGNPFAVAFIDIRMPPGWDGIQTATRIRQSDPNIEIVIVTAFSDRSRQEIVQAVGAPDKLLYLRKPFDTEELTQVALSLTEKWNVARQEQEQKAAIDSLLGVLRQTQNYLKNIIDSMPSMLIGLDAQGEVTHWNQEAERATGITAEQAEGQLLRVVFAVLAKEMGDIIAAIQTRQPSKKEKVALWWREKMRYADITFYPLLTNGITGAVLRVDDVTERVHFEERLIQSDKMISVGGLAAGMAHEINNPLSSILQKAQVVENRLSPRLDKNIHLAETCGTSINAIHTYVDQRGILQLISGIREAGGRTARIVKSMLSFSRQSTVMASENLQDLIEEAVELAKNDYDLKHHYHFRRFTLHREYADTLPLVWCEKVKIEQVILNLLINAAQAIDEEKIQATPQITLRLRQEKNMACLEIEDNGPGMAEATRLRIFEPFFTTKAVGAGTGLGLSLAYFIITQHHQGKMQVTSTLGKGTNFIIHLPLQRNA